MVVEIIKEIGCLREVDAVKELKEIIAEVENEHIKKIHKKTINKIKMILKENE